MMIVYVVIYPNTGITVSSLRAINFVYRKTPGPAHSRGRRRWANHTEQHARFRQQK